MMSTVFTVSLLLVVVSETFAQSTVEQTSGVFFSSMVPRGNMGPPKHIHRNTVRAPHIPPHVAARAQRLTDDQHSNSNNEDVTDRSSRTQNKSGPTMSVIEGSSNSRTDFIHEPLERRDVQDSPNRAESKRNGEEIIFPDTKFKPRVMCDNLTYCENVGSYPKDHLNIILKNDPGLYDNYFGEDLLSIDTRFGNPDETQLCESTEKVIFPKVAQNKADQWMFIVNLDESYKQGVRVELCNKDDSPCHFSTNFPAGYKSSCKQKYIFRKLLGVNAEGMPAPDSFRLPSCCACYYSKTN